MNAVMVSVDDKGLFIRKGTTIYRPAQDGDVGALKPRLTTRAWAGVDCPPGRLNVDTLKGIKLWRRS